MIRKRNIVVWSIITILLILVITIPLTLHLTNQSTSMDTGIAACKTIADNSKLEKKQESDVPMTKEDYDQVRRPFERSAYADIKVAGLNFVDTVYKADQASTEEGDLGEIMLLMTTLQSQYAALQVACGTHGITLPPLG